MHVFCFQWKCMWAVAKLHTASQGWPFPPLKLFHLLSNNSSPGWRRWGLEVRAFMWEYRDLRQSSQGETLCVCGLWHYHSLSLWHAGYLCRFKLPQTEERSEQGSPRSSVSTLTFQPLGEVSEYGPPSLAVFSVGTSPGGVSKNNFTGEMGKGQVFCGWRQTSGVEALLCSYKWEVNNGETISKPEA